MRPGIWMSTGTMAAATHPSWKRVSNCANALPRFASGASCCTVDSNARRPIEAAKFTMPANNRPATTPPTSVARRPVAAITLSAPIIIVSSRTRRRTRGAIALPVMVSKLAKPSDRPNQIKPASWARNQKKRWKKVNPTPALINSIAVDASTTRSECSSMRSARLADRVAIASFGRRVAATKATTKIDAE
jgi:hypothetical protein